METTRRYCQDGHIYQTAPEFQPCCPKAKPTNALKEECPWGHPYDEANTYWYLRTRRCRTCRRERQRRRKGHQPQRKRRLVRDFVKLRDRGLCRYCGQPGQEVDHVVPRCNDGPDDAFDNLVWSCKECNAVKGREAGFTLKQERLYWHGHLVAPGSIFGAELLKEIEAQRLERQLAQGLGHLVSYKENRGGAEHD